LWVYSYEDSFFQDDFQNLRYCTDNKYGFDIGSITETEFYKEVYSHCSGLHLHTETCVPMENLEFQFGVIDCSEGIESRQLLISLL